ncbi:hypothetical protein FQN57_003017 [Myotisia sp. PD_48]|nr:hypothetical protein FQN57_003017 [Myotisia sp. PD_48]
MAPSAKPVLALKTPKSAAFPSELHDSPLFSSKTESIKHDFMKTPITPPQAYTDFLRTLTPILTSPAPLSANKDKDTFSSFSYPNSAYLTSSACMTCQHKSPIPATPASATSPVHIHHHHYHQCDKPRHAPRSVKPVIRRLSPKASPSTASPSSGCIKSPLSNSESSTETGTTQYPTCSSCSRPVRVRHVVTRTITYKRTPLEPAPKGKRRKTEK